MILHVTAGNTVAQELKLMLPVAHTSTVNTIVQTNDRKFLLSASDDKTVKLWDARLGVLLLNLQLTAEVNAAVLNGANTAFATATADGVVGVYNRQGKNLYQRKFFGNYIKPLFAANDSVLIVVAGNAVFFLNAYDGKEIKIVRVKDAVAAALSKDQHHMLCVSNQGNAFLIDTRTLQYFECRGNVGNVSDYLTRASVTFSNDGQKCLAVGDSGVIVWDTKNGEPLYRIRSKVQFASVSFSPDGRRLLASYWHAPTLLYDGNTGKQLYAFPYKCLVSKFSPDGTTLLFGDSDDWSVSVVQTADYKIVSRFTVNYTISNLFFTFSGKSILIAGDQGEIHLYDAETGESTRNFTGYVSANWTSTFSPVSHSLITAPQDGSLKIWDVEKGRIESVIWNIRYRAAYSSDGKYIIAPSWDSTARIFSVATGKAIIEFPKQKSLVKLAQLNRKGNTAFTISDDNILQLWDARTGTLLSQEELPGDVMEAAFTPDGSKLFVSYYYEKELEVRSGSTASLVYKLPVDGQMDHLFFSNDSKSFFCKSYSEIITGDVTSGKIFLRLSDKSGSFSSISLSPDERHLLISKEDSLCLWDWKQGKIVRSSNAGARFDDCFFSPDGGTIICITDKHELEFRNRESFQVSKTLKAHDSYLSAHDFSFDRKYLVTCAADRTCKLWDVGKQELIYTFFNVWQEDHMALLPNGYYLASPNAAQLLYYVNPKLEYIFFDQLDAKFNRPDLVLQAAGCADTTLIASYRNAYRKRVKKLGFAIPDETTTPVLPEFVFLNKEELTDSILAATQISLRIHSSAAKGLLQRLNVWMNGKPLWGATGLSLQSRSLQTFDTVCTIELTRGLNLIEGSVTNADGLESIRSSVHLGNNPVRAKEPIVHFIGIGIDKFKEPGHDLRWSVKDIRDLADSFAIRHKGHCIIDTLFDSNVTIDKVLALKQKIKQLGIDDKLIIAYSGHGLLDDQFNYYLSTYDVHFDKPEEGGLLYESFESLFDGIAPWQKLMLIDACHSGEVDKEEMQRYTFVKDKLDTTNRGISLKLNDNRKLGMQNSFELMQLMFANTGRSVGGTIISAASGTQLAQERGDLKNGVFTYSILEYMKTHPVCYVSDLSFYVNRRVPELTFGMQRPTNRIVEKVDWQVW